MKIGEASDSHRIVMRM